MEYYYKQLDEQGNLTGLLTCSMHLESSERQVEIIKEEYDELLAEFNRQEDLGVFDPNYNQE